MNAHDVPLRASVAVLRRLARMPDAPALVLRGGLMMRLWSGAVPRPIEDLDFLARFPFHEGATVARLEALFRVDAGDGFSFGDSRSEVIWAETPFPGVRIHVRTLLPGVETPFELRIDTGFGDPMEPAPAWVDYTSEDGAPARVLACRPETLLAWKVHSLFERGKGRFRPKDLFDACLLLRHAPLELDALPRALRLAFDSRGDSLELMERLVSGEFGQSPWSLEKWARYRRAEPEGRPEQLSEVVSETGQALRPVWEAARALPSSRVSTTR
ncbi:nucleotidyl transferase AbiEii/AbiGii toxin family protein [Myxococcus sp. K15C18031901]|uniref:nucleotidyl transferase AbiEii/AbiGii toxin family protein n=1 Tax=Myxococcus dinghuensis TaxID=2906761 RepID=UPI0020A6FD23|nr:nucleotidyl transferase AbiEii/AbiGii toxin family protein [Myxococcus dinghuensis]MCP3100348.1 nucleotidyl transferase AbiEii/AbiGii toxin family protein [Myxococcus dinghuensis]